MFLRRHGVLKLSPQHMVELQKGHDQVRDGLWFQPNNSYPENLNDPEQHTRFVLVSLSHHTAWAVLHCSLSASQILDGRCTASTALDSLNLWMIKSQNFAKIVLIFLKSCIAEEILANMIRPVYITWKERVLFLQRATGFHPFITHSSRNLSRSTLPKSCFALNSAFHLFLAQKTLSIQAVFKLHVLPCPASLSTWLKCGHSSEFSKETKAPISAYTDIGNPVVPGRCLTQHPAPHQLFSSMKGPFHPFNAPLLYSALRPIKVKVLEEP